MMPIVFWASLAPWFRLKNAAESSCSRRNHRSTRDGGAEGEGGHEVEKRGPDDGLARRQNARRDDGCDRVRRVVKSVDEIEDERDQDQAADQIQHRRLIRA